MPRTVDADQRRTEFTDAAARIIARSGVEAATMREVAAEAGWTTGAVTHYFADKRELLLATLQDSLTNRRAQRPGPGEATAEERLRASLEGALALDADRRRHWLVTLAFATQAAADAELARVQRAAYREFRRHIEGLVEEAGLADRGAGRVLAEQLISAADGIAIQALFDPRAWTPARQTATLHELYVKVRHGTTPPRNRVSGNGGRPSSGAIGEA